MTTLNAYATLAEYKAYWQNRGGTTVADAGDDTVIEGLLKSASRLLESKTGRHFWPYIETRYFDIPDGDSIDPRLLKLDDTLLEVISITNGTGVVIPSTEYMLQPGNYEPHTGIRLNDNSTYYWSPSGSGNVHDVIQVTGIWGYHQHYRLAWLSATTAAEAMDASETGYDVTSSTPFAVGSLIRFDNELGYVSVVGTNTLTITRGENGSTADTHLTSINIYIWQVDELAKNAVLEITNTAYNRRFGQSTSNTETITGAGIVLSPRDIPSMAQEFIATFRNYL